MEEQLPYRAEYAKSGRSGCKSCKTPIPKDTLRLAVMVQSTMFDGKVPNWYHFECFFSKQRPKTVGDVAHFDSLRWEDQEKITKKIESGLACGSGATSSVNGKSKAKKRGASNASGDFCIEYAKSGRAVCRGCEQKILKDEVRVSKKDYETDVGRRYGGQDLWHHVECFAKLRNDLEFWESGSTLPGIKTLSKEDQRNVVKHLPKVDPKPVKDEVDGVSPVKKVKTDPKIAEEDKAIKEQSKTIFKYRDLLKQELSKKDLVSLLEYNKQKVPSGAEQILDRLGDIMTFGRLLPCRECNGGQFVFRSGVGYQCLGSVSEWVKCQNKTQDPPRDRFKVPSALKEKFPFLEEYSYVPRKRIIRIVPSSETSSYPVKLEPDEESKPRVERPAPPLTNMEFVIWKTKKDKEELKRQINKLGGKVSSKIHSMVFAVISNQDEIDHESSKMMQAQSNDVHVVTEDFIDAVQNGESPLSALEKTSISSWGGNAEKRIHAAKDTHKSHFTSQSMFKSKSGTVKLKLKGGLAVDPVSGLEDVAHVYKDKKDVYTTALCITDIQNDKNSYYKLQVLEGDKGQSYWLFRSWGRIGTTVGGSKVEKMATLNEAKALFEELFLEKTGNSWANRKHFVKRSGKMYPMDVDYGNNEKIKSLDTSESAIKSKLADPVQELIKTIFDVETMKKCMMEFELDLEKMPLGKLSKRQLKEAYAVLKAALTLVETESKQDVKSVNASAKFYEYSNQFFTLVPHDFGINRAPLLNNAEIIKSKIDVLDNLLEIEIAYSLLDYAGEGQDGVNPIDAQYEKLKADIEVVDRKSKEFEMLEMYVHNTHAATHNQYKLEIEEVFKVRRHGEDRCFKPFKKLPNRKLLWHGSRLTNYAGILSQGLRIAPPEAPVTGYMFGKGIYFADMVSKSANYCMTSRTNPTGYVLLCEVALGNMYECTRAEYIEHLPKGMNSCKGIGKTMPDPTKSVILEDGVEVPLGPGITDVDVDTSLLYNEYIVYDTAQVKFQYLFKLRFKY